LLRVREGCMYGVDDDHRGMLDDILLGHVQHSNKTVGRSIAISPVRSASYTHNPQPQRLLSHELHVSVSALATALVQWNTQWTHPPNLQTVRGNSVPGQLRTRTRTSNNALPIRTGSRPIIGQKSHRDLGINAGSRSQLSTQTPLAHPLDDE
jgi:hypothetical protein